MPLGSPAVGTDSHRRHPQPIRSPTLIADHDARSQYYVPNFYAALATPPRKTARRLKTARHLSITVPTIAITPRKCIIPRSAPLMLPAQPNQSLIDGLSVLQALAVSTEPVGGRAL